MNSNFALVVGLGLSCFGLGFVFGKWIKSIRQFFDAI